MNILIDIGHPAHVHLLRNLYFELLKKDIGIIVTVKDNLSSSKQLLNYYKIPFYTIGTKSDSLISKAIKQISYNLKIAKLVKQNNIDVAIGTSINIAHASKISKMRSIVLDDDDDDIQPLFTKFAHPFCDVLLSPEALRGHRKKKDTIYYSGNHELAYLHPNRFTPDKSVLSECGIREGEKYFVMRFNSFKAHHDIGIHGISLINKRKLVENLKIHGKIFITTERAIEPEFQEYQIKIEPYKIHSFIYFAEMFIGDSQTMTSEAAVLGIPSLKCNSFAGKLSVPNELENIYKLCYSYLPEDFDRMMDKIKNLLLDASTKIKWNELKNKFLKDKIDVTAFYLWVVENYPNSIKELKNNPNYYENFK